MEPAKPEVGRSLDYLIVPAMKEKPSGSSLRTGPGAAPGAGAMVPNNTASLERANENLRKEIATRHRLEKEMLEISDREQQRIGRNLHDDLGQRLVGISYLCHLLAGNLKSSGSREAGQAEKITRLLNEALALTRSLARGLHPVSLSSGGLLPALTDLSVQTSEIFGVLCIFSHPPQEPAIPDSLATHLYRIAREAVINAVHHGKAGEIRIELGYQPEKTTLTVTDNGVGMPKLNPRRLGMGLRIMSYRADVIGGMLDFTTPSTGGTRVTCIVPGCLKPVSQSAVTPV